MIIEYVGLRCYVSKKEQDAYKKIRELCVEASSSRACTNVSYHFRNGLVDGNYYLEVSISDDESVSSNQQSGHEADYPIASAVTIHPLLILQTLRLVKHLYLQLDCNSNNNLR
jgi:hypothetical protein